MKRSTAMATGVGTVGAAAVAVMMTVAHVRTAPVPRPATRPQPSTRQVVVVPSVVPAPVLPPATRTTPAPSPAPPVSAPATSLSDSLSYLTPRYSDSPLTEYAPKRGRVASASFGLLGGAAVAPAAIEAPVAVSALVTSCPPAAPDTAESRSNTDRANRWAESASAAALAAGKGAARYDYLRCRGDIIADWLADGTPEPLRWLAEVEGYDSPLAVCTYRFPFMWTSSSPLVPDHPLPRDAAGWTGATVTYVGTSHDVDITPDDCVKDDSGAWQCAAVVTGECRKGVDGATVSTWAKRTECRQGGRVVPCQQR